MTDAELEHLAAETAARCYLSGFTAMRNTILATLQKVSEAERGATTDVALMLLRSQRDQLSAKLTAAETQVERLKGESEELLIKNNRLADDADKAEFYLKQSRQELKAERRERGLKSIDRICDTCGGEKDSEGRCAMCLQATLTATEAQLAEARKEAEKAHAAYVIEHSGRCVDLKQLAAATAEVEKLREAVKTTTEWIEQKADHPQSCQLHAIRGEHSCTCGLFEAAKQGRAAMSNSEKQ